MFEAKVVLEWRNRLSGNTRGYYRANTDGHYVGLTDYLIEARLFDSVEEARVAAGVMRNIDVGGFPRTKKEWIENPPYILHWVHVSILITAEGIPLFKEKNAGNEAA